MSGGAIPVTVLTGFLGSGKTTVLNRLLRRPDMAGAAVIVNEFGEVGLDHLLIEASEEQFTLLDNGCICCTVRGDLVETLSRLAQAGETGETPPLDRVVIETTGLADPAPILHTLMAEPRLAGRFRIGGVVTTFDAVNGLATLARHPEAAKQVAVADRLLITKTDLKEAAGMADIEARLSELAPTAERVFARSGEVDMDVLAQPSFDPEAAPERAALWLQRAAAIDAEHACDAGCEHHHEAGHHHAHGIRSYSFIVEAPVEQAGLSRWLDYLCALKGEDLLRFKGLVCLADDPERPMVLHGVQHVFHPPTRLEAWPSPDRRTRLVFIVRDIERETIERTLARFAGIRAGSANPPERTAA